MHCKVQSWHVIYVVNTTKVKKKLQKHIKKYHVLELKRS